MSPPGTLMGFIKKITLAVFLLLTIYGYEVYRIVVAPSEEAER
jgi:hypothetical protein